jgi:hypothetical protein
MKLKNIFSILGAFSASITTMPVIAGDIIGFQTPSGNIHCLLYGQELRCDLRENKAKIPPIPKSCENDWGNAFSMKQRGNAYRICHGDTVANADNMLLKYGKIFRAQGFVCTSRKVGLTCLNKDKKGWFLSRESQRFF